MNDLHRIVSSESEQLILVDRDDNEIGYVSKADAHDGAGMLHRAFSLFLFNDAGELLLQQRAPEKRLWGGYWSNSCCSHPRRGESLDIATSRRLLDELNSRPISSMSITSATRRASVMRDRRTSFATCISASRQMICGPMTAK